VGQALTELAALADLELALEGPGPADQAPAEQPKPPGEVPIRYRGDPAGRLIIDPPEPEPITTRAANALTSLVEHMLDREIAVGDLAEALMTGYEELNLLYSLLPAIATKVDPAEIGDVLVAKAAKILGCRRISLMVLDEKRQNHRLLASRGLPETLRGVSVPVSGSVAGQSLSESDLLIVNNMTGRPDLSRLSQGQYESESFAVVRVPLQAHGEAIGCLTVTEREDGTEFTARDHKLLEGLSAMGASVLLNCRLHTAINKQMISTIHALASAVDAKDHYTHDHAGRVAQLCVATARYLGISDATTCREVELGGLMHDIGKIGVPDAILSKPGKLTPDEFKQVQSHVHIGARIVGHVPGLEGVAKAILHHHERYDGLGYPSGLAGSNIPLASALIAVVDAFDALTSDRHYRKAGTVADALAELNRCKSTQFDPRVVEAFTDVANRESTLADPKQQPEDSLITPRPALTVT
jgi:HD-GYP domain-containing protein (c-di-GMP phosphodiesterase class II)